MSASAGSSSCHTTGGDVSTSALSHGWAHQATTSQRDSPPSSISPPMGMASHMPPSASMLTTPNPVSSASYFEHPNPEPLCQMTYPQMSASSSPSGSTSLHPHQATASSKGKEYHDSKRIKVEAHRGQAQSTSLTPPVMASSSHDGVGRFDEDPGHFRSFEIDYSKVYGPTGQARFMTEMVPRLGKGFYVNPEKAATFTEPNVPATIEEDFLDDNAFEQALSDDDEDSPENLDQPDAHASEDDLLPQTEVPQMEPPQPDRPQTEQLPASASYSAPPPPAWDESHLAMPPSTMGLSPSPMWNTMQQPSAVPVPTPNPAGNMFALTPEERRRLIEIALGPSGLPMYMPPSRFNFNMGNDFFYQPMHQANPMSMRFGIGNDPAALRLLSTDQSASESSPAPHPRPTQSAHPHPAAIAAAGYPGARDGKSARQHYRHHPRVDTTTAGMHARAGPAPSRRMMAESSAKGRSADRVAHNDVERKYRTNLRDKIAELRNAVPVLRQAYEAERSPAAASSKVSKGTVLTKATEYIHHLEQRNRDIMTEHQHLTHRLQAFETLLHSSLHAEMIPSHSMTLFDPRGFC